jgi:hypothetical protein
MEVLIFGGMWVWVVCTISGQIIEGIYSIFQFTGIRAYRYKDQ